MGESPNLFIKKAAETMLVIGGFVGAGALGGLAVDAVHGNVTSKEGPMGGLSYRIHSDEGTLSTDNRNLIKDSRESRKIEIKLGEQCVAAYIPYSAKGPLAKSSEDSVVSDISDLPGQPCGENKTQIRIKLRKLINLQHNILNTKKEIKGTTPELVALKKERKKDNDFDCYAYGAPVGLIAYGIRKIWRSNKLAELID